MQDVIQDIKVIEEDLENFEKKIEIFFVVVGENINTSSYIN